MERKLKLLLLSIFMTSEASALFCWSCLNRTENNFCLTDQYPPQVVNDACPVIPDYEWALGTRPLCFKTEKTEIAPDGSELKAVRRGCTTGGGFKDFCIDQEKNDSSIKCLICNMDSCNAGNLIHPTIIFVVTFIIVTGMCAFQL